MKDMFTLLLILLYSSEAAFIITVLFTLMFIASIKRKNIVSRLPFFVAVAAFSPLAPIQVMSCMAGFNISGIFPYPLAIISGIVLAITAFCLYIRINVFPADNTSHYLKNYSKSQIGLIGARRLILAGTIVTAVYIIPIIAASVVWLDFLNDAVIQDADNIFKAFENIITSLTFPIANIVIAAPSLMIILMFVVPAVSSIMFISGCIHYIIKTDMTAGKRLLFILLSFVPVLNIIYGISCLIKIPKKLKEAQI